MMTTTTDTTTILAALRAALRAALHAGVSAEMLRDERRAPGAILRTCGLMVAS